jgi:hypothetical protein
MPVRPAYIFGIDEYLKPIDEKVVPVYAALGRAIFVCSSLEKLLLVDIANRLVAESGLDERLGPALMDLESKPAGRLFARLGEIGLENELAERIGDVIDRRNAVVHRLVEVPGAAVALSTGEGAEPLIDLLDQLTADCLKLSEEIAERVFPGAEQALGTSLAELLEAARRKDLGEIKDPRLREQFKFIQEVDLDKLG